MELPLDREQDGFWGDLLMEPVLGERLVVLGGGRESYTISGLFEKMAFKPVIAINIFIG